MMFNTDELRGAIGRAYCDEFNSEKVVDPILSEAIIKEIQKLTIGYQWTDQPPTKPGRYVYRKGAQYEEAVQWILRGAKEFLVAFDKCRSVSTNIPNGQWAGPFVIDEKQPEQAQRSPKEQHPLLAAIERSGLGDPLGGILRRHAEPLVAENAAAKARDAVYGEMRAMRDLLGRIRESPNRGTQWQKEIDALVASTEPAESEVRLMLEKVARRLEDGFCSNPLFPREQAGEIRELLARTESLTKN